MPSLSPPPDGLRERLADLVANRFHSLVGTARSAGAGADAEDVVQDVVARFLEHGRELPEQADALAAYLRRSVARDSGRRIARRPGPLPGEVRDPAPELADLLEDRRRVRAYARALERLPGDIRPVLLLDVAGLDRATIARRTGRSERSVKRVLAEHTGAVLARAVADVDGTACVRLTATLDALAANGWRPRPDGETARHLEVCDACRLAYLEARRTRIAVGSGLLLPAALARKASVGVLVRSLRGVTHLRRAVLLPALATVSAVAPLVVLPTVDSLPGHTARASEPAYVAGPVEPPLRHPAARVVPVARAAARPVPATRRTSRPARIPHAPKKTIPRRTPPRATIVAVPPAPLPPPAPPPPPPPSPPTAPPAATRSSCVFGSATIGC